MSSTNEIHCDGPCAIFDVRQIEPCNAHMRRIREDEAVRFACPNCVKVKVRGQLRLDRECDIHYV